MTSKLESLSKRVDDLIALAQDALAHMRQGSFGPIVRSEDFTNFRASSLSFIRMVFGQDHSYFTEFNARVTDVHDYEVKYGLGILTAIKNELLGGWLVTTRGLISGEVFSDFLEMAEHLLSESYKDPAAVLVGGVLEEHLRQLAGKANIELTALKDGKAIPRKADSLNNDLAKVGQYGKLDQKSVTSWLDLRNKAAHGKYAEYTAPQVELMLSGVRDFVARISL